LLAEEYSGRTERATSLVSDAINKHLDKKGLYPFAEKYWSVLNRSWGKDKDETIALADIGNISPHDGPEILGLITSNEAEFGRLTLLTMNPNGLYSPTQAITLPCEANFAQLVTVDLDGNGRDEVLFNTLAVTETQPIIRDHLFVFTWDETELKLLFEETGFFPDSMTRGVYAADLEDDGVYEIVQEHPFFDLGSRDPIPWDLDWPTLDRVYSVYKWEAETGRYHFWQKRREPYDRPSETEILEEANP
jgi:hypothetical protein